MQYLVTGATGFIGSYVVERLLARGHDVVGLDRNLTWAHEPVTTSGSGRVTTVLGEVADLAVVADAVKSHGVERIIHLAAELHQRSASQPGQCIQSNVIGTYNVLEAARLFGVSRVVLASSAALFGTLDQQPDLPLAEDARIYAGDVYEASKVFGETLGEFYASQFGVENTSLRIGLAYGAACVLGTARRFQDELIVKPLAGDPGRYEFEPEAMMNFVYIHDTAEAFVLASEVPGPLSSVYHVRGDYRSIADAIAIARDLIPGADILPGTAEHRWPMDFDDTRFRKDVGYTCEWSLEAGLQDIVDEIAGRVPAQMGTAAG